MRLLNRASTDLVAHFLRAYPLRTGTMIVLLILAGLAEGVGIVTLLPVLEVATGEVEPGLSAVSRIAAGVLRFVGLAPTLAAFLGLVVAAITAKGLFRWLAMRQVGDAIARVASDLRLRLLRAVMAARWSHFASEPLGHFANAVSTEVFRAAFAYRSACAALAALIQVVIYCAVALVISWKLTLLAIPSGVAIMLLLGGFVRASRRMGWEYTTGVKALVSRITEVVQGIKPLKAMGRETPVLELLEQENERLRRAERGLALAAESLRSFHEPILAAAVALGLYAAATWGGQPFPTLLLLIFLFHRVIGRLHIVQSEYQGMAAGESAFWSLHEQACRAEAEREPMRGEPPPPLEEGITFAGVSFRHGSAEVLRDVSLHIPAGSFVAITGRSGAGKTTLVDLIIGLHRPMAGKVLVDGVPLGELDLHAWRRRIGYVPQETLLLHDTIARNLSLGLEGVGREEIERALRVAGAWDFVARLPQGLESVVGERGMKLSGGERQRIAIARALVGRPSVLILDEATAGLDVATEAGICRTLRRLRGSMTIVAVSHHPTVAEAADLAFELDAGVVVQPAAPLAPA